MGNIGSGALKNCCQPRDEDVSEGYRDDDPKVMMEVSSDETETESEEESEEEQQQYEAPVEEEESEDEEESEEQAILNDRSTLALCNIPLKSNSIEQVSTAVSRMIKELTGKPVGVKSAIMLPHRSPDGQAISNTAKLGYWSNAVGASSDLCQNKLNQLCVFVPALRTLETLESEPLEIGGQCITAQLFCEYHKHNLKQAQIWEEGRSAREAKQRAQEREEEIQRKEKEELAVHMAEQAAEAAKEQQQKEHEREDEDEDKDEEETVETDRSDMGDEVADAADGSSISGIRNLIPTSSAAGAELTAGAEHAWASMKSLF